MRYEYKRPRHIDGLFRDERGAQWGYLRQMEKVASGEVRKKNRVQSLDRLADEEGNTLVVEPLQRKKGLFEKIIGYLPFVDEEGQEGCLRIMGRARGKLVLVTVLVMVLLSVGGYLLYQSARPADDTPIRIASGEMYNPNPENIRLPGITEVHAQAGDPHVQQLLLNVEGNAYNLTYTITLDDSGEVLYVSRAIPPGYGVREFVMKRTFAAGEYPITIHVASSALDDYEGDSSAAFNAGELDAVLVVR